MTLFCQTHGLNMVPILNRNFTLPDTIQELLDFSNGFSTMGTKVNREGIVIRLENNPNVSFKVRSPLYIDKHDKKKNKD